MYTPKQAYWRIQRGQSESFYLWVDGDVSARDLYFTAREIYDQAADDIELKSDDSEITMSYSSTLFKTKVTIIFLPATTQALTADYYFGELMHTANGDLTTGIISHKIKIKLDKDVRIAADDA